MRQHRHYGQYIDKAVKTLKKGQSDYKYIDLVWDGLDKEYDICVQIKLKKKRKMVKPNV